MKRSRINPISKKRAKRIAGFNKNVPPAYKAGIYVCSVCGSPPDFRGIHRSHIKHKSLGGDDSPENIEYRCAKCHFTGKHRIIEK
jgi:DNA-directed RNA polymerase subunit RPC12/RpoP